ncbi:carboxypeptidase-like regulatory domain-containing protein, partial [Aduncisulcus paluster]
MVTVELNKEQQIYDVYMVEKATTIKEVIVKAPGIHEKGDTITYVTSSFAGVEDKSLADVLKKMPGIEIEESGKIKYNGVEINKFYIEGKDLLGGRYGLATNNVHHQDVGSVEVMENHQPIKALEDISFSQNPAINIRLKEDAKARW